ncbi:hypothetical protein GW17_00030328 [Ensete ventricosum]|nr:hypothetical protein GW17_00030328 [Ensete ventricosum]
MSCGFPLRGIHRGYSVVGVLTTSALLLVLVLLLLWVLKVPGFVICYFLCHTRQSVIELLQFAIKLARDWLASATAAASGGVSVAMPSVSWNGTIARVMDHIETVAKAIDCSSVVKAIFEMVSVMAKNLMDAVKLVAQFAPQR